MPNKLHQPGVLWIAADMHLGPQAPATNLAFLDFLHEASAKADALFLCGDIFNAWIGDDQTKGNEAWLQDICQGLSTFSARHPLYLMRGNRDFLLGADFAAQVGAKLLPDQIILHSDMGKILLSHGDEYCTDDQSYQRFRRIVRWPWLQGGYLALPLSWRQAIAGYFRRQSQRQNQFKASYIMDVNAAAITQAIAPHPDAIALIHGHTHRPARHPILPEQACQRWVLPDWDYDHDTRGGYICIEQNQLCLIQVQQPALCQVSSLLKQP